MLIKNLFKYWTYQVFAPGTVLRKKYESFKSLLEYDKCAHELMAELEEIYYSQAKVDFTVIKDKYDDFSNCVHQIVKCLQQMNPSRYLDLMDYFKKFDFYIRYMLSTPTYDYSPPFSIPLQNINEPDLALTGGKALSLATARRSLNLPTPEGFVITTSAFYYFIEYNNLRNAIDKLLSALDIQDTVVLNRISSELVRLIESANIPSDIETSIFHSFDALAQTVETSPRVAVRSSAVGEDTRSSFAGQYQTVLNVGRDRILAAYKTVLASKYSSEALYYRINYGLTDMETPMAVLVLEMIDASASGVMYTCDLSDPESKRMEIHSIWGLGELLVKGEVSPDIFTVKKRERPVIVDKRAGLKSKRMILAEKGNTQIEPIENAKRESLSLDDVSVMTLADWGVRLETHAHEPQDVEWCRASDGSLYLLQSRPLNAGETTDPLTECHFEEISNPVLISGGDRASPGVGAGPVFKIRNSSDLVHIPENAVLVANHASSTYVKVMDKLSAVVIDAGSTAGHFASVAREFGVPTLVNTLVATECLKNGREVTVYADDKKVYDGIVHSLLENPCARKNLISDSPFMKKLEYIISFVSPLILLDPGDKKFTPGGCRSMHDIIRFAHEKSVQEMFSIGNRRTGRRMGAKKLISDIPLQMYILDVGGGLSEKTVHGKEIQTAHIQSTPFQAVWRGLNHPDIEWSQFTHFNWEEYDKIVMSGGIINADSAQLASYAVISREYLNLNLKFGYHFVILDTICSQRTGKNHILFRFSGGGGDILGRSLRAEFLCYVMGHLGFEVNKKSDLVDAKLLEAPEEIIVEKLDILGRLLGATRLMDMYMKEEGQVIAFAEEFLNGRYHFSTLPINSHARPRTIKYE